MVPGQMALTRRGASSKASALVRPSIAALIAQPAAKFKKGF